LTAAQNVLSFKTIPQLSKIMAFEGKGSPIRNEDFICNKAIKHVYCFKFIGYYIICESEIVITERFYIAIEQRK
jgi:hypothetical protein